MRPFFCTTCRTWLAWGVRARGCPKCRSLERHRAFALLLPALAELAGPGICLDVAPATCLDLTLGELDTLQVVRVDFDPAADRRTVDVQASVTQLPFPDGSAQLVMCSHVLEHVPDDRAAMRELGRVLSDTGIGLVVVPYRPGRTDEDPDASTEERIRRFGQADHVRYYGDDFEDRLAESGLQYLATDFAAVLPEEAITLSRLNGAERFWLVRPAGAAPLPPLAELASATRALAVKVVETAHTDTGPMMAGLQLATYRIDGQLKEIDRLTALLNGRNDRIVQLKAERRAQRPLRTKLVRRAKKDARRVVGKLRQVVSPPSD